MAYIRKNHLTINEETEVWEIVEEGGEIVIWFGTEEELTERLGHPYWEAGDTC